MEEGRVKGQEGAAVLAPPTPSSSIPSAGQTLQAGGTQANVSEGFALNPVSLYSLPSVFPLLWEPGGKAASVIAPVNRSAEEVMLELSLRPVLVGREGHPCRREHKGSGRKRLVCLGKSRH